MTRLPLATLLTIGIGAISPSSAKSAQAETQLRIESSSGSGPASFGRIEALELGPDGTVYVLDGIENNLRAFARNGQHRWSFGREGEGPGEFRAAMGLTIGPNGELWVIDPEVQRATVIDSDGELITTHRLPAGIALSPWPGRFDRYGNLYSYLPSSGTEYGFHMVRYDAELEPVATIKLPTDPSLDRFFEGRTERGSHMRARIPFTPRVVWRLDSGGDVIWARTNALQFLRRGGDVSDVELGGIAATPPPVEVEDRAAAIDGLRRFVDLGGRIDEAQIPRTKPVMQTFVLDDQDRIWSVRSGKTGGRSRMIDVFNPQGERLTSIAIPFALASFPTPVIRGGTLVGIERDAFGIETVVVVELPSVGN